jgi:hypothetical protein
MTDFGPFASEEVVGFGNGSALGVQPAGWKWLWVHFPQAGYKWGRSRNQRSENACIPQVEHMQRILC